MENFISDNLQGTGHSRSDSDRNGRAIGAATTEARGGENVKERGPQAGEVGVWRGLSAV